MYQLKQNYRLESEHAVLINYHSTMHNYYTTSQVVGM
jgi:hypothetical protein